MLTPSGDRGQISERRSCGGAHGPAVLHLVDKRDGVVLGADEAAAVFAEEEFRSSLPSGNTPDTFTGRDPAAGEMYVHSGSVASACSSRRAYRSAGVEGARCRNGFRGMPVVPSERVAAVTW